MSSRSIGVSACLCAITMNLVLTGCRSTVDRRTFVLNAAREGISTKAAPGGHILRVHRFAIDSPFDTRRLIYRTGEHQYESDFHNQFLASPADMVTERTRTWLAQSGVFSRVLDPGSTVYPSHSLEGNITALYADLRDESAPKGVLEMRVFLVKESPTKDVIIFGKSYGAACNLKSRDPDAVVEAFGDCLATILTHLETDLQEQF